MKTHGAERVTNQQIRKIKIRAEKYAQNRDFREQEDLESAGQRKRFLLGGKPDKRDRYEVQSPLCITPAALLLYYT